MKKTWLSLAPAGYIINRLHIYSILATILSILSVLTPYGLIVAFVTNPQMRQVTTTLEGKAVA